MLTNGGSIRLSASDLVGHLHCAHLTSLDIAVQKGTLQKPRVWDPMLEVLRERGARHEQEFVRQLEAGGRTATVIDGKGIDSASVQKTAEAIKRGADVIIQGVFET